MSDNTTPRPWEIKDDHLVIEPRSMTYVADCALSDSEDESINAIMARAMVNAELIVRAVNAHDELIKGADATLMEHAAAGEGVCVCDICSTFRPIVDADSDAMIANGEVTP